MYPFISVSFTISYIHKLGRVLQLMLTGIPVGGSESLSLYLHQGIKKQWSDIITKVNLPVLVHSIAEITPNTDGGKTENDVYVA